MAAVHRDFDGVRIEGAHYAVLLHPLIDWREPGDATLAISVIGAPQSSDDRWASLADEGEQRYFTAADVAFERTASGADELRCLHARHADFPAYRPGFVFTLEPGMRAFLETELPRVERVAFAIAAVRDALEPHLGRDPHPHERHAIGELVALLMLDGHPPADALAQARGYDGERLFGEDGDHASYTELGVALRRPDVMRALAGCAGTA